MDPRLVLVGRWVKTAEELGFEATLDLMTDLSGVAKSLQVPSPAFKAPTVQAPTKPEKAPQTPQKSAQGQKRAVAAGPHEACGTKWYAKGPKRQWHKDKNGSTQHICHLKHPHDGNCRCECDSHRLSRDSRVKRRQQYYADKEAP